MAIVVDQARQNVTDNPATMRFMQFYNASAETHIGFAYDPPVNNQADAWVPLQSTQFAA